jgi:3-dehydroquinate synthase
MKVITAKTKLKSYPVYVNADFDSLFPEIVNKSFKDADKIILVTNNRVFSIYEGKIKSALDKCSKLNEIIIIQDGEEYKNLESADYIYSRLIDFNAHRNDIIVAFGGGVTGDLAGFAASTFNRGMKLIQCPTTIISQVDSSIGGKVGVNYKKVKNIIGSFYQPDAVIVDPAFNYTLDGEQIINGLGEVVKYGIVFDKDILRKLLKNTGEEGKNKPEELIKTEDFKDIIYRCCKIKTKVVRKDEFDTGYRNLLNFGHTIGHCIENAFDLKEISHGKAVSIGMIIAIDISISLGFLKEDFKEKIIELYKMLGLPCKMPEIDVEKIINVIKYDKKFKTSQNKFVLLKGVNKPFFYYNLDENMIVDNIKKSMYN